MTTGPLDADAVTDLARPAPGSASPSPVAGPTQTLDESEAWAPRRGLARSVGIAIHVIPFVCATASSLVLGRLLPRPHEYWIAVWWLAVVAGAQVALWTAERGMQRFVPLSTLLDVSAVFPDHAPSRFSMALRMGNVQKTNKAALLAVEEGLPSNLDEALSVALTMVSLLGNHDRGTRGHSERVRAYSELLGEEMGLDRQARQRLKWGAILHDIGKLAVPAAILNKPGKPDRDEWAILQTHPGHATRILAPLEAWLGDAFHAADQHHERWDGRGYPNGLAGQDIALSARIVAVADAFTVMTTARAYKKPMSIELARRELTRGAGTQFDPAVVRAMLSLSIGRITRTAGPAAALINIPFLGSLLSGASAVPAAVASGAVAAGVTAIAVVAAPVTPGPPAVRPSVVRPSAMEWTTPVRWDKSPAPLQFDPPQDLAFAADREPTTTGARTTTTTLRTLPTRSGANASLIWSVGGSGHTVPNDATDTRPTPAEPLRVSPSAEPTHTTSPPESRQPVPATIIGPGPTPPTSPPGVTATARPSTADSTTPTTTTTLPPPSTSTSVFATTTIGTTTIDEVAPTTAVATTAVATTVVSTTPAATPATTAAPATDPPTTVPSVPTTSPATVVETTTPTVPDTCRSRGKATGNPHC